MAKKMTKTLTVDIDIRVDKRKWSDAQRTLFKRIYLLMEMDLLFGPGEIKCSKASWHRARTELAGVVSELSFDLLAKRKRSV